MIIINQNVKFKISIVRNIRPEIRLAVYRALYIELRDPPPIGNFDVKKNVLSKFTNLKVCAKKTTITSYRKMALETRIEDRI